MTVENDPNLGAKVCVTSPCHENDYTWATSYLKAGTTNECIAACVADTEYLDDNYECKLCSDTIVKKFYQLMNNLFEIDWLYKMCAKCK